MNQEFVVTAIGAILALALFYIPGVSTRFDTLTGDVKRLVLLGMAAVVAGVAIGGACIGIDIGANAVCPIGVPPQFWYDLVVLIVISAGAAQVVYTGAQIVTPKPE